MERRAVCQFGGTCLPGNGAFKFIALCYAFPKLLSRTKASKLTLVRLRLCIEIYTHL